MSELPSTDRIIEHLAALVACDTQNPPRAITPGNDIFCYCNGVLDAVGGFTVDITDHDDGRVSYLAVRGEPSLLFNVHLDTVPVGTGWTRPALELTVEDGKAYGRGACDIKGAAAVLLGLAEVTDAPMAMLFTTDEEGASGCCVKEFTAQLPSDRFAQIVVAEPTQCEAILAHRGYLSVLGQFDGVPGHSSEARALADSAVHKACQWAAKAVDYAADKADQDEGICFNLGTISGGSASNVIAHQANVHWSARLAPGGSNEAELAAISTLTDDAKAVAWNARFAGPPLPAAGQTDSGSRAWAEQHNVPIGEPVDFWTEASLFSAVGQNAVVLGPGNIEQAHTADEWVTLEQLERAATIYQRLILAHADVPASAVDATA